jgi:exopolysaccharide biosynthesis polyprenyl glycosylphosphotransferase
MGVLVNSIKRSFYLNLLKQFDVAISALCFALVTLPLSRWDANFIPHSLSIRIRLINIFIFSALLLIWHFCFLACGLYESKRLSTLSSQLLDTAKGTFAGAAVLAVFSLLFNIQMVSPLGVVKFWLLNTAAFLIGRVMLRAMLGAVRRRGRNLRYILVLGTNQRAVRFAKRLELKPDLGYRIQGFADEPWEGTDLSVVQSGRLCCTLDGLSDFLRHNVVDEVAMYLPLRSFYETAARVAVLCEKHGILLRFDPDLFNLKTARPRTEIFDGDAMMTAYTGRLEGWPSLIKRGLDVVASLFLLTMFSPLLLVAAALVKLTSKGPVFFLQERVGFNKRRFRVYKFRTMVAEAEKLQSNLEAQNEVEGPVFKIKKDPRITPVGVFLRRTSIDELPQLLNVLRGEMSLVGPRPLPVRDYQGFSEDWQRRRFSVRPGITCLWQVNGRSSIPFDRWMELDIQYLDEWSLWLDFKILARTLPAVIKGSGAA